MRSARNVTVVGRVAVFIPLLCALTCSPVAFAQRIRSFHNASQATNDRPPSLPGARKLANGHVMINGEEHRWMRPGWMTSAGPNPHPWYLVRVRNYDIPERGSQSMTQAQMLETLVRMERHEKRAKYYRQLTEKLRRARDSRQPRKQEHRLLSFAEWDKKRVEHWAEQGSSAQDRRPVSFAEWDKKRVEYWAKQGSSAQKVKPRPAGSSSIASKHTATINGAGTPPCDYVGDNGDRPRGEGNCHPVKRRARNPWAGTHLQEWNCEFPTRSYER